MLFMSAEHIAVMNALLQDAPSVRSACAELSQPRVMAYVLTNGPDGAVVHWTVAFADTVRFSLEEAASPDVRCIGDWTQMIEAARAGRDGHHVAPGLSIEGDESVLAEINAALEAAGAVATVPVEFPST